VRGKQIVLYGEPRSRAFRCIWMLEELALDFQLVPVRIAETRTPELLAINPNGRVPALVDAELADDWAAGPLGVLDSALARSDWLVESRFTVADLNVAVMFRRPVLARVERGPWPRVSRWLERCEARPAWQRMASRYAAG
jgi:glutathione S-transferase